MADEVRVGENVAKLVGVWERRKQLAILVFAAAFAISATVTFALPNIYQSTASLMFVDQQFLPPFHDGPDARLPTRRQKIPIRSRLDQLIHQFDLYPTERTKLSADALVERMQRDIEVKPISFHLTGNLTVFTVKYQGPDPTTVALVANTLASYFVYENTKFRILEPAVPATMPSAPNRPRLLLMSLALSTGLAIGLVLLAEQFDTSVHTVAVTLTRLVLLGLLVILGLTTHAAGAQAIDTPANPDTYRIGPEDVLLISVWKNEAMSRMVRVRPDGKISLPLLNAMQAAGLTTRELRDVLIERLKDFIPSPEVSVIVADVRSTKVGVDRTTVLMNVPAGGLAGGFMRPRPLMWDGILMPNGKPFPR